MSDPLYSILFGLVIAAMLAIGLGSNILRTRAARRSFSEGNARIGVTFGAMRRLARVRERHLMIVICADLLALLLIMNSTIDDVPALVVLPPLFAFLFAVVSPAKRAGQLTRATPDANRNAVSDGTRVFLVHDNRIIAWIGASPSALADAGVFPAAKVQRP